MLNDNEISSKIKCERKKQNLKQIDLSKRAGISNSYLSDIEVGRTFPSLKVLTKIAKALNLDCTIFFKGDNK